MSKRVFVVGLVLMLSACGGGAGPSAAVPGQQTPGTASVTYVGTRSVTAGGTVAPGLPSLGTYAVTETDRLTSASPGAPAGTTRELREDITYALAAPAIAGVEPHAQTSVVYEGAAADGAATLLGRAESITESDRDAEQHVTGSVTGTRTSIETYDAARPLFGPFAPGESQHVTETTSSATTPGGTFIDLDFTRTVRGDGSYDESGSLALAEIHTVHVAAGLSAASHDTIPGFFLRDVSVAAPNGALAVVLSTQGRTVGNPPVVTQTYSTPVWYAWTGAPLNGTRGAVAGVSPDPLCGTYAIPLTRVHERISRLDPANGAIENRSEDDYLDASGTAFCRITAVTSSTYDVTTGAQTGSRVDRTVVVLAAPTSTTTFTATLSGRRGTR